MITEEVIIKNTTVSSLLLEELETSEINDRFFIGTVLVVRSMLHGRPFGDTPSPLPRSSSPSVEKAHAVQRKTE
jgi:hypothetical protein